MTAGDGSRGEIWHPRPRSADLCPDAVIVVPGIMGSALRDTESGDLLWGLRSLGWYRRAWTGDGLAALRPTDEELSGRTARIVPDGLLRGPAFVPLIGLIEPYTALVKGVRRAVLRDDAVAEFAYDWRLPVRRNARLLAEAAHDHLKGWRERSGRRDAKLVIVAHSMGGLLARALGLISGATDDVRAVVTLGTPFYGSVKAAMIISGGRGAPLPLPRRRLRALASALPGVHDLLPGYRCVDTGDDFVRLAPERVAELGGDLGLARDAADLHDALRGVELPGHRAVIGTRQPTPQSLEIRDGVAHALYHAPKFRDGELLRDAHGRPRRFDRYGDGTVYRDAATVVSGLHLAVQHGGMPRDSAVVDQVCAILTEDEPGSLMGGGDLGLHVPDVVSAGSSWRMHVTGTAYPASVTVTVADALTGREEDPPELRTGGDPALGGRSDGVEDDPDDGGPTGVVHADATLERPGLYRVTAEGGGGAPISQLVLATDPLDGT